MARTPAPLLIHGWFVFLQEGQQSTEGVQNRRIHFAALRLVESFASSGRSAQIFEPIRLA
jgi:hypothetical protein